MSSDNMDKLDLINAIKTNDIERMENKAENIIGLLGQANEIKKSQINTEKFYSRLKEDLDYAFYFSNQIENFAKFNQITSNYYFVYEKYRRNMYKYFFKGIFPLIYYHLSIFSEKLFKNNEDYQRTKKNYINIKILAYHIINKSYYF